MLDARYHLFYSIAVILMLGFGILIGASYYGPVQVSQTRKMVDTLRVETNVVVQERDQARDLLTKDEKALAALRPALVRGKLTGRRVMLIQTGDYADATEAANIAVSDAGATVVATVILTRKWGDLTPQQRASLGTIGGAGEPATQNAALLAALAGALSGGTETGGSQAAALQTMLDQGLITVSGDLSKPCSLFVLIAGNQDDGMPNTIEGPLLDAFKSASDNAVVVGCEPFSAAVSSIPTFQKAGVATVDCIDLPLGQLALPFALRGEPGDYGLKPTASRQLPTTLGGEPGL